MKTLFSQVHFHKKQVLGLIVFVLCSAVAQMLLPSLLAQMIQHGVIEQSINQIHYYGWIMASVAILSCLVSFGSVKMASCLSTEFGSQIRRLVFCKIQNFSAIEMDHFSTASLVTRCTSDVTNVQNFLTLLLRIGLLAPMMAFAGLVFSSMTGGNVSSVLLVSIPILLIGLTVLMILASRYSIQLRKKIDQINHLFLESLEGVRVIRTFHKERFENQRFEKANDEHAMIAYTTGKIGSLLMPMISVLFGCTTAAVLGIGAYDVQIGTMPVASLVASSQYISMVLTSVMMLSLVIMMFPTTYACAKRIEEVIDVEPMIQDGTMSLDQRPLRNHVEFKHVTFAYPGASEPVLKDISFTARPGQVTAIIGGTGRGKSTIVKLIPRLYDPMFGEILVDGMDIRSYRKEDLRSLIGYVPQKNVLFSGDIGSNLNFGNENGTDVDWQEACRVACAQEFIDQKKDQYHQRVSQGGTNFSGGQKQRLAIARALMKHPEIYIFDDSFSALDLKTDLQVRKHLKESIGDATVIMVAQRISSIMDADQILVIDDGRIVGQGKHEELLQSCSLYQEIAQLQLGKEVA